MCWEAVKISGGSCKFQYFKSGPKNRDIIMTCSVASQHSFEFRDNIVVLVVIGSFEHLEGVTGRVAQIGFSEIRSTSPTV